MKKTTSVTVFGILNIVTMLLMAQSALAQSWSQSTSSFLPWTAVTSSANGSQIWAALTNGPVFHSTNSGASWKTVNWGNAYYTTGLASSPNGDVLAAVTGYRTPGKIYVSTNSGATWPATTAPLLYWTSIACSADGNKLAATATNGAVCISTDTGKTWTTRSVPAKNWVSISMSADGSQLAVVSTNGLLCVSTDGGDSWTTNNPNSSNLTQSQARKNTPKIGNGAPNTNWQAVACSADKSRLVAVVNGGPVYLSTDAGTNWTASSAPTANWKAVACSADGMTIIAAINNGPIYTSTDAGATWVSNSIPLAPWASVTVSADGSRLAAATGIFSQGRSLIYTLYNSPKPHLGLAVSSSQTGLAWTMPGTNFIVQQSSDLAVTGWLTLTNEPTLNLTNLQYQLSLPMTNGMGFFRLSTP